jgi:hypothetical protein
MEKTDKGITVQDFLLQASRLPLGAQLYAAATEKNADKGMKIVKDLMAKTGVAHEEVTTEIAAAIHKAVREFVQNSGFHFPGDLPKY